MQNILVGCPLFRGLSGEQIRKIIDDRGDYSITRYKKGDVIARKDSAYSGLLIIVEGRVHGETTYPSGKKTLIEPMEAPQPIAPAFLFGGYNKLPIDVVADSDVTILTLHRGYLFELMQDNVVIMSNFIDIISDRANGWSRKIYFLSFRSLKEKVASYLLDNSTEESPVVPMPGAAETSQYFDATRSAVTTVLDGLGKKGWVKTDGDAITVLNRKALRDIIE